MKKVINVVMIFAFIVSGLSVISKPTYADTFNQNNIMDDIIFDNYNSMTELQIQSFLNTFPSSCLSNYSSPYPIDYFTYGSNVAASKVVWQVSQLWKINPQVILSTLQKEQSLVSGGSGCAGSKYTAAMGYDCPDSNLRYDYPNLGVYQTCVKREKNVGFSSQVNHAAWQLMFNRQRAYGNLAWDDDSAITYGGFMTAGNRARVGGQQPTYYDGYATIDGASVYMSNGATAALYFYTPHFHGNQLFQSIFFQWFGTTHGAQDGQLVKASSTSGIYKIEVGTKRPFPSEEVFLSYSYNWASVVNISASELSFIPNGTAMDYNVHYRDGQLVRSSTTGRISYVESGTLRYIPNLIIASSRGYNISTAKTISDTELSYIPKGADVTYNNNYRDGQLVKASSTSGIYKIEVGTKRPFPSEEVFLSYSYNWASVVNISASELSFIPNGTAMDYNVHYRDGQLVRSSTTGRISYVESGTLRYIPNLIIASSRGYNISTAKTISDTELSYIPKGADVTYNNNYRDGQLVRSSTTGRISYVESGTLRYIPNLIIASSRGYNISTAKTISDTELSYIPKGADVTIL